MWPIETTMSRKPMAGKILFCVVVSIMGSFVGKA
jgi:hypothetical protein